MVDVTCEQPMGPCRLGSLIVRTSSSKEMSVYKPVVLTVISVFYRLNDDIAFAQDGDRSHHQVVGD